MSFSARRFWTFAPLPPRCWRMGVRLGSALTLGLIAVSGAPTQIPMPMPGGAPAGPPTLPHGLRGAVEIPDPWRWLRVGGVGLLVAGVCALGFWLWWRSRTQRPGPAGPSPDDVARQRLQRALALLDEPTSLVAEVSGAVRTYLEARFGLRAPERTTEEFIGELQGNAALDERHQPALAEFLGACDLVKFAGVRLGRTELEELHAAALRLVNELAPSGRPPALPGTNPSPGGSP